MYLILCPTDKRITYITDTVTHLDNGNIKLTSGVEVIAGTFEIQQADSVPEGVVAEQYKYENGQFVKIDTNTYTNELKIAMDAIANKQEKINVTGNILKTDGNGNIIAAVPGEDYLTNESLATTEKAGLIKIAADASKTGITITEDGVLQLQPATAAQIADYTNPDNDHAPICMSNLKNAVRSIPLLVTDFASGATLNCVAGGIYVCTSADCASLTVTIPTVEVGKDICIKFHSGATATKLTIANKIIIANSFTDTPDTNCYCTLLAESDPTTNKWIVSYREVDD